MNDITLIGDILLYAGLPGIVIFAILLATRSKWWINAQGKSLLAITVALSLICLQIGATLFFGTDYFGRDLIRAIVYGFFAIASWYFAVSLIRAQNKFHKEDKRLLAEYKDAIERESEHVKDENVGVVAFPVKIINLPWWARIKTKKKK